MVKTADSGSAALMVQGPTLTPRATTATPLIDAVSRDDVPAVKALLVAHADVNARNRKGETALSIAVENHRSDIPALLKQ